MCQQLGHIIVNGEKILVLSRVVVKGRKRDNGYNSLKIRKSGEDGIFFDSESDYLSEHPLTLKDLKDGIIVSL